MLQNLGAKALTFIVDLHECFLERLLGILFDNLFQGLAISLGRIDCLSGIMGSTIESGESL